MLYCLHPSGEKLPADVEVIQRYGYQVGNTTPFTGMLIQEEVPVPIPAVEPISTATATTKIPAY